MSSADDADPLLIACRYCRAVTGKRCRVGWSGKEAKACHKARVDDAASMKAAAPVAAAREGGAVSRAFYPDCLGCGHNASGVVANVCTTFVAYPEGDPRGLAGYCLHRCVDDPAIRAWLSGRQGR